VHGGDQPTIRYEIVLLDQREEKDVRTIQQVQVPYAQVCARMLIVLPAGRILARLNWLDGKHAKQNYGASESRPLTRDI